jgi:hypothetical protein
MIFDDQAIPSPANPIRRRRRHTRKARYGNTEERIGVASTTHVVDVVDGVLKTPRLKTTIRSVVKVQVAINTSEGMMHYLY